jgi:ADP-L-glycero-D-manno-heptose 6-epimerase
MALIVTGGAGFIGSTLVRKLNELGQRDLWLVEAWDHAESWRNLVDLEFAEILHFQDFLALADSGKLPKVEGVFHLGACTDTLETRLAHVLAVNTRFSQRILGICQQLRCPLVYASSASVYGNSQRPDSPARAEQPLNAYAYSKLLFDRYLQQRLLNQATPVYGFRFFNVYGCHESHKGRMASMVYQLGQQARHGGVMRLFRGFDGDSDGGQQRDFIHVDDVVAVLLKALGHADRRGIYDLGTGAPHTFLAVARAWQSVSPATVEFIDCPPHVQRAYQRYTCADPVPLAEAGLATSWLGIEAGVARMAAQQEWP